MRTTYLIFARLCIVVLFIFSGSSADAKIYKYQDEQGHWHFTDTPVGDIPEDTPDQRPSADLSEIRDIESQMINAYDPQTPIDQAAIAVVAIHTGSKYRTGFFITDNGYLITHRDSLKSETVKSNVEMDPNKIEENRRTLKQAKRWLANQEANLKTAEEQLQQLKFQAENETEPVLREQKQQDYEKTRFDVARKKGFLVKKRNQYMRLEQNVEASRNAMAGGDTEAEYEETIRVELKGFSSYPARLVATSMRYNLALLKIDNCKSPIIEMLERDAVQKGMPVTVIGNPHKHEITRHTGTVVNFAGDFIKSSAFSSSYDSGGPLLTEDGRWIGVVFHRAPIGDRGDLQSGYALSADALMKEFEVYINP